MIGIRLTREATIRGYHERVSRMQGKIAANKAQASHFVVGCEHDRIISWKAAAVLRARRGFCCGRPAGTQTRRRGSPLHKIRGRPLLDCMAGTSGTTTSMPADVLAEAERAAAGWTSIALVAQVSPAARTQLEACGLTPAHAALATKQLLPLLREMIVARTIAWSDYAQRLKPPEAANLHMLRPPSVESRHHAVKSEYSSSSPASCLVHLIVARYKEDVSWLNELPPRVSYHVMQKDALQPEMPPERQTQLTNVGRESHSYLSYFLSCVAGLHGELPPLLVCCQGNPFEHNQNFLSDVAALVAWKEAEAAAATPAPTLAAEVPPRLFVPLGIWSGGERLICCDASGAPHQAKLVPIGRTWRGLFGDARPMPLWLSFTPGANFAVDTKLVLRLPPAFYERALACGLCASADPIEGHAFERLWLYLLLADDEIANVFQQIPHWFHPA